MDAERDEIDVRELALREMVAALPEAERADALRSLLDEMETMHAAPAPRPPPGSPACAPGWARKSRGGTSEMAVDR
jgi:hypothetical protein